MADPKTVDAVKSFVSNVENHADEVQTAVAAAPDPEAATTSAGTTVTSVTEAATNLGKDAADVSNKINKAITEFNAIAGKVEEYAGDATKVGEDLEGFVWIPGIGQGLAAIGGVLVLAGGAVTKLASLAEEEAAPIVKALEEASDAFKEASTVLTDIGDDIKKFANIVLDAKEEWDKAGEAFEADAKAAEDKLVKVADAIEKEAEGIIEGIVEEVEHVAKVVAETVVEGWDEVLSWFGDSHKKHANKAKHLVEQAEKQEAHLGTHGEKLTNAANALTGILPAAS